MAWVTSCSGRAPLLRETCWPCAEFCWHAAVLDSRAPRRSVARARPSSRRVAGRHHAPPDAPRAAASPANTGSAQHRPDRGPLRLMRWLLLRHQADRPVAHLHGIWLRWPRAHPSALCHDPDLAKVGASSKPGAVQFMVSARRMLCRFALSSRDPFAACVIFIFRISISLSGSVIERSRRPASPLGQHGCRLGTAMRTTGVTPRQR